jgi:hypothetical protein
MSRRTRIGLLSLAIFLAGYGVTSTLNDMDFLPNWAEYVIGAAYAWAHYFILLPGYGEKNIAR